MTTTRPIWKKRKSRKKKGRGIGKRRWKPRTTKKTQVKFYRPVFQNKNTQQEGKYAPVVAAPVVAAPVVAAPVVAAPVVAAPVVVPDEEEDNIPHSIMGGGRRKSRRKKRRRKSRKKRKTKRRRKRKTRKRR